MKKVAEMEQIILSTEEYYTLLELQAESKWGRFGCNTRREVWPKPGLGFTQPEDRDHKQGECHVLDEIVTVVVRAKYRAGDFYVNREGAFLAVDDSQNVEFFFEDEW